MGVKVLIIGKGLTGLVAVWQILENSKENEIEIEIVSDGSGASPYVHGLNVPLYPKDKVETFWRDTMEGGYGLSDPQLADCLCRESVNVPEMLGKLQIFLEKKDGAYKLLKPLGSTWPRVACSGNHTGAEIMHRLGELLECRKEVHFTPHTRALRLDVQGGKAVGALLWEKEKKEFVYKRADVILLASGGFCGIYPFSTNMEDSGGDGIAMAYEAGALLTDMEFIQFEPSMAIYPEKVRGKSVITTMFYEGAVLKNGKNERFMKPDGSEGPGECVGKDLLSKAIYKEIQEKRATKHGGVYFDATGVGSERLNESYRSYVKRYEKAGIDITKEPFEIAPGAHTSLGGVVVDVSCKTSVKGLFAAGEITGGLHGANRVGGNAGLETLVFGKQAAEGILRYIREQKNAPQGTEKLEEEGTFFSLAEEQDKPSMKEEELFTIRGRMEALLQNNLFVLRNGKDLEAAVSSLEEMEDYVKGHTCHQHLYEKLRLENDLICAGLLARAALTRRESVGCHVREDALEEDWHYHVRIKKEENGKQTLWKEKIQEE